ncbi:MAG: FAD-dependent monooxygenase [Candidatus Korobacteraceae bacterium]
MHESIHETEVFVGGGGPAGLAAAVAARMAGFAVTVVDCAQPPIDKACGEGIMPDGLSVLAQLGVTVNPETAAPFRGIRFVNGDNRVEASFARGVGYGLKRTVLHQLLIDRAMDLGASLHWGARITGVCEKGVLVNGKRVPCRWLLCADGHNSLLRKLTGLDLGRPTLRRFGFRRHYKLAPWSDFVEVHWSDCGQMYITPVSDDEICVALITRRTGLRFDEALAYFPELSERLRTAALENRDLGALSVSRDISTVQLGDVALLGEASGSVDAVTGEGLSMAFRQAIAVAEAMRAGDLLRYEVAHRRIARLPRLMSRLMLAMDNHPSLRSRAFRALAAEPDYFRRLLAMHTGANSPASFGVRESLSLGWRLLRLEPRSN